MDAFGAGERGAERTADPAGTWVLRLDDSWSACGPGAGNERLVLRAVAAVLSTQQAIASHASAALLAELPVWTLPRRPCITVPPRVTGDARYAHLLRARIGADHIHADTGVPRTACARTVLDLAREHGVEDAVVTGDAALARGMVDAAALTSCAQYCAGWPGIRRAERMIGLLDGRSESPVESVSRLRLCQAGLSKPEPQMEIYSRDGIFLGRTDLYWEQFGVAGEVDGRVKYREAPDEAFWQEKQRQEAIENTGLIVVRWGRSDLNAMPRLVARLQAAFARGARLTGGREWITVPSQQQYERTETPRAG